MEQYFAEEKVSHERMTAMAEGIAGAAVLTGLQTIIAGESYKDRSAAKVLDELIAEYAADESKHEDLIRLVSGMQKTMKETSAFSEQILEKSRNQPVRGDYAFERVSERMKEHSPGAYTNQLLRVNERRSGNQELLAEIVQMLDEETRNNSFFFNHSLKRGFNIQDEDGDYLLTLDEFSENEIISASRTNGETVFRANERTLRITHEGVTLNDVSIGNPELSTDEEDGTRYRMIRILSLLGYSVDDVAGMTYITKPKTETPAIFDLSAEEVVKAAFAKTKGE